jgi:hypothetical protein
MGVPEGLIRGRLPLVDHPFHVGTIKNPQLILTITPAVKVDFLAEAKSCRFDEQN